MVKVRHAKIEDVESACKIAVEAWGPIFDNYRKLLGDELFDILHKDWKERKTDEDSKSLWKIPRMDACYGKESGNRRIHYLQPGRKEKDRGDWKQCSKA